MDSISSFRFIFKKRQTLPIYFAGISLIDFRKIILILRTQIETYNLFVTDLRQFNNSWLGHREKLDILYQIATFDSEICKSNK